jgi:F-type H+-transporting ATPase subunit b
MENLKSDNEKILKEAKIERENMLKDAREIKTKLISDAENQAKEQASKLIESAQLAIQNEKNSAMSELKQTVVELSVGIAEKVISSELEDKNKQLKVVENMLNDASLNN